MTPRHPDLAEIAERDARYAYEAYEFIITAYHYTQKMLGRTLPRRGEKADPGQHHVTGRQLLEGIRALARREFGLMAGTVFKCWGIRRTDDFGDIVFNLVEGGLMTKTETDCRDDFHNVFDLGDSLMRDYEIKIEDS